MIDFFTNQNTIFRIFRGYHNRVISEIQVSLGLTTKVVGVKQKDSKVDVFVCAGMVIGHLI